MVVKINSMASLPASANKPEMASMKPQELNEMCPVKPDRRADPDNHCKKL